MSVAEIERIYVEHGSEMFSTFALVSMLAKSKYRTDHLSRLFSEAFLRRRRSRPTPSLLSTQKLRRMLLVIMRNATTGSPWPVTNNPNAMRTTIRYSRELQSANSTLAIASGQHSRPPTFVASSQSSSGLHEFMFVDGAVTPYNNSFAYCDPDGDFFHAIGLNGPRRGRIFFTLFQSALEAKQPDYQISWPIKLIFTIISGFVPAALISSISAEQDLICRVMGDLLSVHRSTKRSVAWQEATWIKSDDLKFRYVRYDTRLDACDDKELLSAFAKSELDDVKLIPALQKLEISMQR